MQFLKRFQRLESPGGFEEENFNGYLNPIAALLTHGSILSGFFECTR